MRVLLDTCVLSELNRDGASDNVRQAVAGLAVDAETARMWGEMTARAQRNGRTVSMADGLIAATALRHGLQIMTRNTADFEPTGAMLINPW